MDSKKQVILETAMKFFAQKGYYSTSVQEIAEECGISKGSLYKFFKSKEDLFIEVYEFYQHDMFEKAMKIDMENVLSKKEKLVKQLVVQMEDFLNKRDFIMLQFKEMPLDEKEKLKALIQRMKANIMNWQRSRLIEAYGPTIEPYIWDLVVMLQGMIKEYLFLIIRDNKQLQLEHIARFIVSRFDSIVKDLVEQKPNGLLNDSMMNTLLHVQTNALTKEEELKQLVEEITGKIMIGTNDEKKTNLLSSLSLIQEELKMNEPRAFLLDALFAYLEKEELLLFSVKKLREVVNRA